MPLDRPNLQLSLELNLDDGEEGSGQPITHERALEISNAARSALMARVQADTLVPADGGMTEWMDDYFMLVNKGWDWRVATWIAWASTPRDGRWPETQEELATEILGLTSDRVISTWRQKNPAIDVTVGALQTERLFQHRGDVFDALIESAKTKDYKNHQDRKLFLEMTGDYVPMHQLKALMASGKLRFSKGLKDLKEEELWQLAGGNWEVLGPMLDDQSDHLAVGEEKNAEPLAE
ncbi:MAG: hypothetical protein DWQ07_14095 [Chloroflexi bacterium]|nr:MAG: hypothetical protein DWQ07_14095 [Chloroflexota bacterium]